MSARGGEIDGRKRRRKRKGNSSNSPHDPDRKLRSSRLHPPSGPFSRVHFSPLVLDPPRVLLRGGIRLVRDALPERNRRREFARVEGCPREGEQATSDGTTFPLPPDHVIRPVSRLLVLFHQKHFNPNFPPESKTRRGSFRYYSRRRVHRPFILLSYVPSHFSRDARGETNQFLLPFPRIVHDRPNRLDPSACSRFFVLLFLFASSIGRFSFSLSLSLFLSPRRGRLIPSTTAILSAREDGTMEATRPGDRSLLDKALTR